MKEVQIEKVWRKIHAHVQNVRNEGNFLQKKSHKIEFNTYFGPSSRLSRSDPPRFNSRDVFCSWFGVLVADVADAGFGARLRDVDDVFKLGVDFSAGVTSFDGVDARESLSLPAAFESGFFGFVAGTKILKFPLVLRSIKKNRWFRIKSKLK